MTHVTMLQEITQCSKWTTVTFEGTKECFSQYYMPKQYYVSFFVHVIFFLVYFLSQNEHWSYKFCSTLYFFCCIYITIASLHCLMLYLQLLSVLGRVAIFIISRDYCYRRNCDFIILWLIWNVGYRYIA